jgi:hypothetical protein
MPMKTRPVHDFLTISALFLPVKSYFIFDKVFNAIRQLRILLRCDIKALGENMEVTELKSTISELSARVDKIRDWL